MRPIYWLIVILLFGILSLPALAAGPANGAKTIYGKVLGIDAPTKQASIAFAVHVSDPNAPGNMPEELAQQATTLADEAAQLEQKGQIATAQRLRKHIEEIRHWRAVEATIPLAGIRVYSANHYPLDSAPQGLVLRVMVSVENPLSSVALPSVVTLNKDATVVMDKHPHPLIRQMPAVPGARKTFFQLVGVVKSVQPLVLDINGLTVQVDNPQNHQFVQQQPISFEDIRPGQKVSASVIMDGELTIGQIRSLTIQPADTK